MNRFALSTAVVLVFGISGPLSAAELTAFRDVAPVASSFIGAERLAMHDNMHKHMDNMMGNMQQPAPQQAVPAQPGGSPQPAEPNANQAKPADPANPGAAHVPPVVPPVVPPSHPTQPPANQGMKHM